MPVTLPTPCTREEVKRALDIKQTARNDAQVDRACEAARDAVEGLLHRRFYIADETNKWDWPNFQRAYPWRIWFDEKELADVTTTVPVVTTGGDASPQTIPSTAIFWGPWNYSPPFRWMELDRSQAFSFGVGATPQRDVSVQGTFGYWLKTRPAGTLAAAVSSTNATTIQVSDGSLVGVGDQIIVGTERMLVTDRTFVDTTYAQQGSGCSTGSMNDNLLSVPDGTKFHTYEELLLDGEQLLIVAIGGNLLTVKRAWNGTTLATHSAAEIYASRNLTVTRGDFGVAAATHSQGDAVKAIVVPGLVKELGVAEAEVYLAQELGAYTGSSTPAASAGTGTGAAREPIPGPGLPDLRDRCVARHGRKLRQRVV